MFNQFYYKVIKKFRFYFILFLSIIAFQCCGDSDIVTVDFSKSLPVSDKSNKNISVKKLKVAIAAMISPKETYIYYNRLIEYIHDKTGFEIKLIQRKTYQEINELFGRGEIDVAFICSGPYSLGKDEYRFEIFASPVIQGSNYYHAYLIVNKENSFFSIEDLKGHSFAFTDPESNTGRLAPINWLHEIGQNPESFFSETIYTYSHDNSILAVSKGLVDGASVDSLIWEYYHKKNPAFIDKTRIIKKSEPFGTPPLVFSRSLSPDIKTKVRDLILSMHKDPEGLKILNELLIDKFVEPEESWYDNIREMAKKYN